MSAKLNELNKAYDNREEYDILKNVAYAALDYAATLEGKLRQACNMIDERTNNGDTKDADAEAFIASCAELLR